MITNDATLLKVKHEVLYEVAKLAYEGRLDDERDNLPYKMVPGPQPFFRCCIYREREVIRQRIRLAEGKAPGTEDDGNVVQIINSACEGCPISRYVVTDNCQTISTWLYIQRPFILTTKSSRPQWRRTFLCSPEPSFSARSWRITNIP